MNSFQIRKGEDLTFLTFRHTEIAKMWAMGDGLVVTPNVFINGIFVAIYLFKQKTPRTI